MNNPTDMALPTHNLNWLFDATNVQGETKRLQCSRPICLSEWDDPRDAAIFFTINETLPGLDGWHLVAPKTIQVWKVAELSDVELA